MSTNISLPMGPSPSWELRDSEQDSSSFLPINESSVVAYSLKQSREKWLTSTFPRFSAKSRSGKAVAPQPPPHSIKSHGRFDLVVGPHVYSSTSIFEVHYTPQPTTTLSKTASFQATVPNPYHAPVQPVAGPSTSASVASPVLSALSPGMVVTPELVQHMDSAAASNPTLLKLVQEVAAGHATQNQKETLELLLQTFKSTPGEVSQPQSSTGVINFSAPQTASRTPDFDIVLEFNDKPGDRWIFPRGPVNIQPIRGHQGEDLIVNAVLPFPSTLDEASGKYKEIVAFRFAGVMFTVHDLMNRWVGGHEKAVEYTRVLNEIAAKWPKRQFLQHQLPPGLLLDQLKAAVTPNFAMKSIKPSNDNARNKRRAPRRSTAQATATNATPQPSAQPRASPSEGRATSDETPTKRRKSNAANPQTPTTTIQIACHSCGQTDVPLMMGGRYCRPCIDSGKAKADIPSATVSRNTAERSGTKPLRRGSTLSAPALVAHSPLATNPPVVFAPVQTPQNIGQSQEHR